MSYLKFYYAAARRGLETAQLAAANLDLQLVAKPADIGRQATNFRRNGKRLLAGQSLLRSLLQDALRKVIFHFLFHGFSLLLSVFNNPTPTAEKKCFYR